MVERVGWSLIDVLWQIAIFGVTVLLLLMMVSWLVVGPWRLAGKLQSRLWA